MSCPMSIWLVQVWGTLFQSPLSMVKCVRQNAAYLIVSSQSWVQRRWQFRLTQTHSFTFFYRNKTLFQVLSITFFFFFCSQDIWPNCSMRIQQSCNAAPTLQKGWNYIEMPKQRLMQLLGPSRRKQISLFLRSWILFFLATSQGP